MLEVLDKSEIETHLPVSVLFHTTPAKNIESIKNNGLFVSNNLGTLDENIIYSLRFPYEYNSNLLIKNKTFSKDKFALTLWNPNDRIVRMHRFKGEYIGGELLDENTVLPEEFLDDQRRSKTMRTSKKDLLKINNEHFLGAIILNEDFEDLIIESFLKIYDRRIKSQGESTYKTSMVTREIENYLNNNENQLVYGNNSNNLLIARRISMSMERTMDLFFKTSKEKSMWELFTDTDLMEKAHLKAKGLAIEVK